MTTDTNVPFKKDSFSQTDISKLQQDTIAADPVFPLEMLFPDICDQVLGVDGKPVAHWQGLMTYLNNLGHSELERRWKKARQIMHEHGVAYDIFNEEKEMERPWEMDPVPFPIPTQSWKFLESGVSQRIRLLTAIYADIYGEQTLIMKKNLPPELFFANPMFLRQCHGLYTKQNMNLHFHATDLCRFPNDQWRVVTDRTQAPSGAGYALENRIILSRILPRMFHSGKVLRLAPFFKRFSNELMEISGMEKREPTVVMLSPGPSGSTYFEHVFLSRYMGITLVESSDLTIRNDSVFLKTLGGLDPVDVILRRIEDNFCDPLVFSGSSVTGVSGLVQAVRAGNVSVCNPLGSAILESPGFIPFLPGLCRLLLGEDLILQDIPTFWCGQPDPLNTVLARINQGNQPMIIGSAFAGSQIQTVDTRELTREKTAELIAKIKAAPYAYVGKELMEPCSLPVWKKGKLKNKAAALRMFSTSMTGSQDINKIDPSILPDDKISVMPGALTRISDNPAGFLMNRVKDNGSKDTWCFSDESVQYTSMLHRFTESLEIHRGSDLPSRVADNMLWLGRYVERTEGMLRVIRIVIDRLNSETRLDLIEEFPFLLRIMSNLQIISPTLSEPDATYKIRILESEILESMFGTQRPGNIRSSLFNVKQAAASVRDRLSNDSWHILGRMENELLAFAPHQHSQISEAQELLNEMILTMSAFAGLALESMTRGMGWRFMDMGRRIERAGYMITLLKSLADSKEKSRSQELEALLEVADSTITYHTRYRTTFQIEPIVDLLLMDELNPRSVGFQMASLFEHVKMLPRETPMPFRTKEEKITLDLTTKLRLSDISELMEIDGEKTMPKLNTLLELLKEGLQDLADTITQHYLSRIQTEKQLRHYFENPAGELHVSEGKSPYEV